MSPIAAALEDIREGRMVILVDDEDRENEGDLCMAAEKATPEAINFMARYGRGLVCLTLTPERARELLLHPMTNENTATFGTNFLVSVDARQGVTTGISAADRAATILKAVDPACRPEDLARPGHVFPLQSKRGGVLVRTGQTEGSVDLARLAGLTPAGVICEIMKDDGTMARMPDLEGFAREHALRIVTIADLVSYRMQHECLVREAGAVPLDLPGAGAVTARIWENEVDPNQHLAIVKGEWTPEDEVLVRVHSECVTGDVFGSDRCDCGPQLHRSLEMIGEAGQGVVLYIRQEGRGIGLANKIRAYALQDQGLDTVQANEALGFKADLRDYGIGAQILFQMGVRKMRLMTNNPRKIVGLEGYGLRVVERVPIQIPPNEKNRFYLKTKKEKLGHLIELGDVDKARGRK